MLLKVIARLLIVAGLILVPGATTMADVGPDTSSTIAKTILIRDARVLDFASDAPTAPRPADVVIENGRIKAVAAPGSVAATADARVVDAGGRILMPGLVDMHVHVWDEAELGSYLARGVTTVRNASGMPFLLEMRDRIAAGMLTGPRLITTGPILNSPGPNAQLNHMMVETADEARAAVRAQHAAGYRRLKVYSNLRREAYEAIRDEAAALGMTIMGHTPEGVRAPGMPRERPFAIPFEELLDDGFVSIEHIESVVWHGLRNELDETAARALARRVAAAGVPVDPTLLAYYNLLRTAQTKGEFLKRPGVDRLNTLIVSYEGENFARWSGEDAVAAQRYFDFYLRATKIFHEEGVMLLTGSDAGIFTNIPGDSLVDELGLLRRAGLTPYEVLKAATFNPARALGQDDWGRIAAGQRANLILVDGDPLVDVSLAGRPWAVVANGKYLSRDDLAALEAAAVNPPTDRTQRNVMSALAAQGSAPQ